MRNVRICISVTGTLVLLSTMLLHLVARYAFFNRNSIPPLPLIMERWIALGVIGNVALSILGNVVFLAGTFGVKGKSYPWTAGISLLVTVLLLNLATVGLLSPLLTITRIVP